MPIHLAGNLELFRAFSHANGLTMIYVLKQLSEACLERVCVDLLVLSKCISFNNVVFHPLDNEMPCLYCANIVVDPFV